MDDRPTQPAPGTAQEDLAPQPPAPQPPAPQPAGPPRLRRRRRGRVLAGVAGGTGDYFGVDPVLVRIILVALTVAGGTGFVLYLLAWATIPAADSDESAAEALLRRVRTAPPWLQALLGGAALVLLAQGFVADGVGIFTGVVLIAIGIALFGRDGTARPAGAAPAPAGWGSGDVQAAPPPFGAGSGASIAGAAPLWAPPPPRPVRPPSILGRLTLAVGLLVLGVAAILDRTGAIELTAERAVALALTVVGAGLLVGALRGRARGLIVLGVALVPALLAANLLGEVSRGGVGERRHRPAELADVRDEYRLLVGSAVVDLSRVDFPERPTEVAASVGVGELTVIVPRDVSVTARGDVRAGALDLFGPWTEGTDLSREVVEPGVEGGGRLVLDVDAGLGAVEVRRATITGGS